MSERNVLPLICPHTHKKLISQKNEESRNWTKILPSNFCTQWEHSDVLYSIENITNVLIDCHGKEILECKKKKCRKAIKIAFNLYFGYKEHKMKVPRVIWKPVKFFTVV